MTRLWKLDATAQAALVRRGEVTALELAELALARAHHFADSVHAFAWLDQERTRQAARAPSPGRFAGVPYALKDVLPFPGWPCAFGSRLFAGLGHVPAEHVPYTRAIEASGVVIVGKTTTSEFGLLGSTESLQAGITRNPWSPTRSAAGSSGGAAAAVAAGIVAFAHGNDGGGSIRIPAAVCGLFGFKPSAGRCEPATVVRNAYAELTAEHCLTRSVRDSAGMLACTERRDAEAPHAPVGFVEPGELRPLRIGLCETTLLGAPACPGGAKAVRDAARLCEQLGHTIEEAPPLTGGDGISDAFFTVAAAAMHDVDTTMSRMLGRPVRDDELEPFTWALIEDYRSRPEESLVRARAAIEAASKRALAHQAQWDVLLSPTIGVATPELGWLAPTLPREELIRRTEALAGYTPVHNMMGAPGMSVPLAHDDDAMPVGVHFSAMPGADATLLRLAYQLEEAAPWRDRWPALAESGPG